MKPISMCNNDLLLMYNWTCIYNIYIYRVTRAHNYLTTCSFGYTLFFALIIIDFIILLASHNHFLLIFADLAMINNSIDLSTCCFYLMQLWHNHMYSICTLLSTAHSAISSKSTLYDYFSRRENFIIFKETIESMADHKVLRHNCNGRMYLSPLQCEYRHPRDQNNCPDQWDVLISGGK